MYEKILPLVIFCGVGIVASLTYVVCLCVFTAKQKRNDQSLAEMTDDDITFNLD